MDVEVLADIADVNALYEESLTNLKDRKPVVKNPSGHSPAEREQAVRDYYASVRTNVCSRFKCVDQIIDRSVQSVAPSLGPVKRKKLGFPLRKPALTTPCSGSVSRRYHRRW